MPRKKKTDDNSKAKPAQGKSFEKEIQQLLEQGRKDGKLEQHKIFELIPDVPANIDVLDQLYVDMADEDIDFVPAEEPTKTEITEEAEWVADTEAEEPVVED